VNDALHFTFDVDIPDVAEDESIRMTNNSVIKSYFFLFGYSVLGSWLSDYLALSNIVLKILLSSPTTYKCTLGFSSFLHFKKVTCSGFIQIYVPISI
jgi:hypothetical protein